MLSGWEESERDEYNIGRFDQNQSSINGTDHSDSHAQSSCSDSGQTATTQDTSITSSIGENERTYGTGFNDTVVQGSVEGGSGNNSLLVSECDSKSGSVSGGTILPWGAHKERSPYPSCMNIDVDIKPGEFVMRTLFADFTVQAERKMEAVMNEPLEKPLSKILQRGEDAQFDQLLGAFGSVAEHCLPSLLRALFAWYERQMAEGVIPQLRKIDMKGKSNEPTERSEAEIVQERRDLAVEFIFCLVLIEVLRQLSFHPGHEDLVGFIETMAFRHFKYREGLQTGPNAANIHIVADLYAEVIGALAQSRFMSVRKKFMAELKELLGKEPSPHTTQSIISLLMGMKFFRVKMVPIEEFEASFQFMQECAQYFLEVKDKDVKHALAGLFVEILVPVAAAVKNEVNVPCLKNFVEKLYPQTLDMCMKSKHRMALFPLVTCLLCVSQKNFFLQSWHCFLAMCLQHLKNRDPKMCRVALESLFRLLWVYMIRIKCESNSATQSRLQSIVNSLFPKGSKTVVPRDTPLNIFVKIIQFIAQERLDFAMREIVFDLLSVGRPIKLILTPERMSIGLRAFLVVADSLQQKEGEPPMPRTMGVLPSGNTLRVKKTYLNKMLTEDTARSIGMSAYFPHVRRVFVDILRALDVHYGRPLMMTNTQNLNKEPDEMITGERKPRIDLFRTCVAAVPRLIPDGMTGVELVDLLSRLTVHMDEELRALAYQSLQTLVLDFPDWRQDVIWGFSQFLARDIQDTFPQLVDNGLRMLLQLLTCWKNALSSASGRQHKDHVDGSRSLTKECPSARKTDLTRADNVWSMFHLVEGLALVMLCQCRLCPRRLSVHILREVKNLFKGFNYPDDELDLPVIDVIDKCCPDVIEKCLGMLPPAEKSAVLATSNIDLQWIADRSSSAWTAGLQDENSPKSSSTQNLSGADPWSFCLFEFMEKDRVLKYCPSAVMHSWPIVFTRLNSLYPVIDPTPVSDNRASLLRSSTTVKKPVNERDLYMHAWKNYVTFAFRVVPPVPNPVVRCASPDFSLKEELIILSSSLTSTFTSSSSPDSLTTEKSDGVKSGNISPTSLYKLVVPLLRCEAVDVRDAAVHALGRTNSDALKDLMDELLVYVREAVDRKQENMRRRRRRDALRLQLVRVFELIAENVLDKDTQSLHSTFVEFIDGARLFLEGESEKDVQAVQDIKLHFCNCVRKMIKSFPLDTCQTLLRRDLRSNLFTVFAGWSGRFGQALGIASASTDDKPCSELQLSVLQAMSALLCCGPCFNPSGLAEDGSLYPWLDMLLASNNEKIYQLGRETIILLLECNSDIGPLLDWVVDRCYTAPPEVADSCFLALATIFSAREYPCDHYTAIINVTLMNTGCPRTQVHETALQLLQVLDKRFFGNVGPLTESDAGGGTLDLLLSTTYCRSQMYLSKQLAQLHPELTMPMFSEITYRFQTARPELRQLLLQYLLPWLYNMELVDPKVPPANPLSYFQYYANEVNRVGGRREGWGSAEATEMVLNNLFYITAKFSDEHPKEVEELWTTLCSCWPNNLKVIIRYLLIISGMAPQELLPYTKRVVLYLARSRPDRLLDEMMNELQMVETLNCLIERTETPPFYRLTSMRKASSHSDGPAGMAGQNDSGNRNELGVEKGTIHTKRHSGEDPIKTGTSKSDSALRALSNYQQQQQQQQRCEKTRTASGPPIVTDDPSTPSTTEPEIVVEDGYCVTRGGQGDRFDIPQPHPLPMPEYGGYFAPLTEYLPNCSQPISGFHRCNVAVMLLTDVVIDGVEVDWSIHVPLMLHILFLGLDHTRPLVHEHCKALLLNLLVVLADHSDHLTVAQILLNSKTKQLGLGLHIPTLPVISHNFTEPDAMFDSYLQGPVLPNLSQAGGTPTTESVGTMSTTTATVTPAIPVIVTSDAISASVSPQPGPNMPIQDVVKSLINFLSSRQNQPLWSYEDITAKVWSIRSAEQLDIFLQHVLRVFRDSLPHAVINERWAQTALQLGLSCSSRHYAGRSLQIFRALRVAITSRMLSDILSRLVETVAEQGEDMQGYVTELLLTLEAAVDSLESDFRPLDFMKEIFKSTPNLNNKDSMGGKRNLCGGAGLGPLTPTPGREGHTRSTSYSVSYSLRNKPGSPASENKDVRLRAHTEVESKSGCSFKNSTNLSRSRSAQSLKLLGDSSSQDDKLTILAQLFWIAVSLLESDYEHEFLLALRLLSRVLHRLPLDRPDARDKVEKLQSQLRWVSFPGVHALLLKGCTSPNTYEAVVPLLSQFTPLLDLSLVDPTQSLAFPMNVIALLPYMLLNFEDANELCIRSAENIAQASSEKGKKLENLGTVMNLYSRRTFSKESFQWTKCVVKYLYDTYAHLSLNILAFLVEVLEKGPPVMQPPVLSIIHCMLHYIDLTSSAAQPINADLLRVIAKYVGGSHWKEALKILKLVVTRSSTLVAPSAIHSHLEPSLSPHPSFSENEIFMKKELPGRTMEFTFDLSQTPVIGRRFIPRKEEKSSVSPRRSVSLSPADGGNITGWKRPWMCQGRVRECLVNVLTTCGQRVGLPKSPSHKGMDDSFYGVEFKDLAGWNDDGDDISTNPSINKVIFSQSSDLMDRQSSMASSTEEVSGPNDLSGGSRRDDAAQDQFGVFKDFDFLEYESESVEGESTDNFNWGVRRRPLLEGKTEQDVISSAHEESVSEDTPVLGKKKRGIAEESSDDEVGSESPLDEVPVHSDFVTAAASNMVYPPSSLNLRERRGSMTRSDTSGSSVGDLGDDTPCNASPSLTGHLSFRSVVRYGAEEAWRQQILNLFTQIPTTSTLELFQLLNRLIKDVISKTIEMTRDACSNLSARGVPLLKSRLINVCDLLSSRADPPHVWFTVDALHEPKFSDALRFGMLEIQQHLETFLDKKEQAAEFVGGINTSTKLHLLAEEDGGGGESGCTDIVLDLGRALYKLHFQLLLLLESAHKMLNSLSAIAKTHQLADISEEVSVVKEALGKAAQEVTFSDRGTPTPTGSPSTSPGSLVTLDSKFEDEAALADLVSEGEWAAALKHARLNRNSWQSESPAPFGDDDDITEILNVYCKLLSKGKSGVFVVTTAETELTEVTSKLRESLYQVLAAVTHLETQMKEVREGQKKSDY